jgi:hypothetical protein
MYAELNILYPKCGVMNIVNIISSTLVQTAFYKECGAAGAVVT